MSVRNKELIERISDQYAKENSEFYLDYLADDIRWNIVGLPAIIGKSNFIEAMKMQELESFPEISIKNIIAEGEYVVVESRGKAITKSGKPYNPAYCDVYRLQDGKILELTTYVVDNAMNNEVLNRE